tara:strand:- start:39 stop:653 length:615 start_codon:yes stop_codon:yes gene_type:complete
MNYKKIYDKLINMAKERNVVDGYTEIHHIVPKSEGGTNDTDNLVVLSGREHFIAHKLLWMDNPTNFSRAATYHMMSNHRGIMWGATYQLAKEVFVGDNHPLRQPKNRVKQLQAVLGKPKSDEHRNKIADALRGVPKSKESIEKMKANLGDRSGKNNSNYGKGKPIIGDGIEYKNAKTAAMAVNTSPQNIFYRLKSTKWNWDYKN